MECFLNDGIIGLFGAFLGAITTGVVSFFTIFFFRRRDRKGKALYLAVRIVNQLDKYAFDCLNVVKDEGLRNAKDIRQPEEKTPPPPIYPNDIDWTSIDCKLMECIVSLTNKAEEADISISHTIEFEVAGPPDYEEFFEERQLQYALLGLKTREIIEKLRNKYSVSSRNVNTCRDEHLESVLQKKVGEIKKKRHDKNKMFKSKLGEIYE